MSGLTAAERESRMQLVSDAAVDLAESIWTEDEPTLAEYELAEAIVRSDWLAARERAAAALALRDAAEVARSELDNEIGSGYTSTYFVRRWLRDRADAVDAAPSQPEQEHSSAGTGHDHMTHAEIMESRASQSEQEDQP